MLLDQQPWTFLSYAGPLAVIAGAGYAIVQQAFEWTWRLAQVEKDAIANASEIERVEEEAEARHEELAKVLACLPRIEVTVQQLVEDRRQSVQRGRRTYDNAKEGG